MLMTQLSQAIKGLPAGATDEPDPAKHVDECLRILRRAKAYLWHGSPHRALQTLENLTWEIGTVERPIYPSAGDFVQACWWKVADSIRVARFFMEI
jgi:hypothetical protein